MLAAVLLAAPAQADPQATVGLTMGAAGAGLNRSIWQATAFHLGVHGDVLFGRERNADFGIGPYAELLTNGFDEIQFGGGLSGLLPVLDTFPIVLSAGLIGQLRYGLGPSKETSIVVGAQVDFAILTLPFVFLINAARGGSSETAPVK